MIYLTAADLLHIAHRVIGPDVVLRDGGLLHSAAARPQATVGGADAYVSLEHKAAALVHSILKNHALVDGNKRLALAALIATLGMNGRRLLMSNNEAYDFIIAIACGMKNDLDAIAQEIAVHTAHR